jgi:NAD(P)-dependent dehydrogenase (short-subunit alcohol dehydrogenase family)
MARYVVRVKTPRSPEDAFAYMADLANFAEWDAGVLTAEPVDGNAVGPGAAFDVRVRSIGSPLTLRYQLVEFDPHHRLVAVAESERLTSRDVITVTPDEDGSIVTYDAELTLNGKLGLADPALGLSFDRIGDRATDGLIDVLQGERLDDGSPDGISGVLDAAIEFPVVTSFTRIGYLVRKQLQGWTELSSYDLTDRVIVLTGATSGLGRAAAHTFAEAGATLVLVGRTDTKNDKVVAELTAATGNPNISQVAADMGDLDQVRALAAEVRSRHDRLDVLIHNAGALSAAREEAPSGIEATVSSQVVGPFLLTSLLLDRLSEANDARVLTMSSGGMYTAGLTVSKLQMAAADYKGAEQYARAKRAQVTLNEMWAERFGDRDISFHALHPGWADTPGVDDALPGFSKIMGPLLRSPEQGADTLVWLAADDVPAEMSGEFWHDRVVRSIHKLPTTRATDTPERRLALWDWVVEASGTDPE